MTLPDVQALPKFRRQHKKFHPKELEAIRAELKRIQANPMIGEPKRGPLGDVRVHKFKLYHQLYLIAYGWDAHARTVYLYALATHENFYKALEHYLQ